MTGCCTPFFSFFLVPLRYNDHFSGTPYFNVESSCDHLVPLLKRHHIPISGTEYLRTTLLSTLLPPPGRSDPNQTNQLTDRSVSDCIISTRLLDKHTLGILFCFVLEPLGRGGVFADCTPSSSNLCISL